MNHKPWTIKAKGDKEVEILLYEQIGVDWWTGDGTTAKAFAEDLKAAGDINKISLRINSPGGDVFEGLAIANQLIAHPAYVTAYVDGIAASIASIIAMAANKVVMAKASMIMIHDPWAGVTGNAEVMRKLADTMDKVAESMVTFYQRHSTLSSEAIRALMIDETWMTVSEAIEKGFADSEFEQPAIAASISPEDFAKFKHAPAALLRKKPNAAIPVPARPALPISIAASAAQERTTMDTAAATATTVVDNYNETAAEIMKLGMKLTSPNEEVVRLIESKASLGTAKDVLYNLFHAQQMDLAAKQASTSGLAQPVISSMSAAERKSYSLVRLIASQVKECGIQATMEQEVSDSIAKVLGKSPRGMYVPTRLNAAGLDTKTGGAGGFTVGTEVQDLIELLRNKMLVRALGARVLSGLKDNMVFPVRLTGSTTSWVGENSGTNVAQSDATFGSKTMSPKTLQGTAALSRQILQQSSSDMEALVRDDLATAHALEIDRVAINGSGLSFQPLGLLKTSGIGNVPIGASGGAPDYPSIVDLEAALANANADSASMKFLTTPTMRAKLRKTQQFASTNGVPVWQQIGDSLGVGDVLGYPGYVSNQVPSTLVKGGSSDCHAIIFGDWSQVLIGEWGVIDIVVDPYSLKKQGLIEVTSFQMVDVLVRQPAAIAAIQDARNV